MMVYVIMNYVITAETLKFAKVIENKDAFNH